MAEFEDELILAVPALRAYARTLTDSRAHADDLVQDAVERALRRRKQFAAGLSVRAWIFAILRNKFVDDLRAGRRLVEDVDGRHAAQLVTPADQLWRLRYADVLAAIAAMTPHTREAVLLVVGAGLTHEEAATICGCPVGTLKSRIRRARRELAAHGDAGDRAGADDARRRAGP